MKYSVDGSKVGTLTNSSGTLVTRPSLIIGATKQSKGERAPDGSKYRCFSYPAPVITSNGGGATASVSVAENQTTITTVVATYTDTIIYSTFGGADYPLFTIDSSTGVLTFFISPDYDTPLDYNGDNVYEVVVMASSPDGKSDTQLISVTVTDVAYPAQAVTFDELTYLINDSLVASASTSFLSTSYWLKISAEAVGNGYVVWEVDPEASGSTYAQFLNDGRLRTQMADVTGSSTLLAYTNASLYDGQWHHVLYSGRSDLTPGEANTRVFYVDGVAVTETGGNTDDAFSQVYGGLPFYIGHDTSDNVLIGDIADLWIAPGVSLLSAGDIPIATRRKFITAGGKPVSLGDNGELPTGTAPTVFLSGDATAFASNRGTGGAFTLTGALTDASTSPSD